MINNICQNTNPSIIDLDTIKNDYSRPMKILYVTHASNLTGASRSLLDLLSGLDRSQITPTVLLRKHGPLEEKLKDIDVPYKIFTYTQATKSPRISRLSLLKRIINYFATQKISNYIIQNDFDLVHQNSLLIDVGMRAALRSKIPYVCHLRELVKEDHGLVFINEQYQSDLVRNSNTAIAISHFVAAKFSNWAPKSGLSIIYDGLNVDEYLISHDNIFDKETVSLLLPGRIVPGKCQLEAIKAIEILKHSNIDVHLTIIGIIGNESYINEIECYISEHNLKSNIDIRVFANDMREIYSNTDILLMCSKYEAMGRVTIEGMLAGCLVIGADSGATPEIVVNRKNGLLYKAGSPQALADCISYAISHPQQMRAIATYAQNWAIARFNNKSYAEKLTDLYHKLI